MSDGEGDELHSPPVLPEGLDEGKVLVGLVFSFVLASQVPAESDLDDDEDAVFLVEGVRVRGWGVWYSSGVDEVRCRAVAGGVQLLNFLTRGSTLGYVEEQSRILRRALRRRSILGCT